MSAEVAQPSSHIRSVGRIALRDRLEVHAIAILGVIVLLKATPMPSGNELVYLVLLAKKWSTDYLAYDWTMAGPWAEKLVFNSLFGPLTLVFSIEAVGWIGRVLVWTCAVLVLMRFAQEYDLPRWLASAAIIVWEVYSDNVHRTYTGYEEVLNGFEAKPIAYILLLGALVGILGGRRVLPWMLLGLSFSMHPAVGLWGSVGVAAAWIVMRPSFGDLARAALFWSVMALPGLWAVLPVATSGAVVGNASGTLEDRAFLVIVRLPHHLDPFTFTKQDVLVLYLFLLFNVLHVRRHRPHAALQFLLAFEIALGVIYAAGFGFRYFDQYAMLKLMPFRLFSVLIPLLFFFHLAHAYQHWRTRPLGPLAVGVAFVSVASLGSFPVQVVDQVRANYRLWTAPADSADRVFRWVAQHTPKDAVVIAPPWRKDALYRTERAQIVNWWFCRNDQIHEWRTRIEALVGPIPIVPHSHGDLIAAMRQAYIGRTESAMSWVARRYGADYLITEAEYEFPLLFREGTYRVYAVGPRVPI